MYYVNTERINRCLEFIPQLSAVCHQVLTRWDAEQSELFSYAQERALHMAIETVTDVGHMLIDGFLMRDASSYEDIIEILHGEDVFSANLATHLSELVKLRKGLVQEFIGLERKAVHPFIEQLPAWLGEFAEAVTTYLQKELRLSSGSD